MTFGRYLAAATVALFLCAASDSFAASSVQSPAPLTPTHASTATLTSAAAVYAHPDGEEPLRMVWSETMWTGRPSVLLITSSRRDAYGELWLKVMLPVRPNGSSGWIRASHARIGDTDMRIEISLRARELRVRKAGHLVLASEIVVGKAETPTPRGLFAVYERADAPPGAVIGPFALHLTAFSNVLHSYDGGPGRVAIHGRAGMLLADPLGSAASHGCIRINNGMLRRLARLAPPGTPVVIGMGWPAQIRRS